MSHILKNAGHFCKSFDYQADKLARYQVLEAVHE